MATKEALKIALAKKKKRLTDQDCIDENICPECGQELKFNNSEWHIELYCPTSTCSNYHKVLEVIG